MSAKISSFQQPSKMPRFIFHGSSPHFRKDGTNKLAVPRGKMLWVRESVDRTERGEKPEGRTPTEKRGEEAERGSLRSQPLWGSHGVTSANRQWSNQGPKGAWNPKPWVLRSRRPCLQGFCGSTCNFSRLDT